MSQKNLLWIDDDIDKLSSYVKELKKNKIHVYIASTYEKALEIFNQNDIGVVVTDIKMPYPNGIEIIRRLHNIKPYKVYAVFSSYLYLKKYRESLSLLDFDVQLMDKDFPNVSDISFYNRFVKPFLNLFDHGVSYTISDQNKSKKNVSGVNPFEIEFADFMMLPIIEKDFLIDKAESMVDNVIGKLFSRGIIWALFCGNSVEPATIAESIEKIPTEVEILKFAQKINRAPYQFSQGMIVEDHWTGCAEDNNISLKDYPTMTFLFADDNDMELHFDTGCPYSLFSYEEFTDKNIIDPTITFIKEKRIGFDKSYWVVLIKDLDVILKSQKSDQTIGVKINGKAIRDWNENSYARFCGSECPARHGIKKKLKKNLCPLRRGLIGRNILIENKLSIILDGELKKTYFVEE